MFPVLFEIARPVPALSVFQVSGATTRQFTGSIFLSTIPAFFWILRLFSLAESP